MKTLKHQIQHSEARKFGSLEILAKQAVEGFITGLHKSPFHGFSVEFAEHRLYNHGESTKHIDWKLYGRTEKLFVKRYEEETNLRCQLVIDTSSSMYFPVGAELNKLSFAIDSAAALIYLMRKQRDAVGVSLFDETLRLHTPCKSSMTHHRFLFAELEKYLRDYQPSEIAKTNVVDALHAVAQQVHRRSLVIIFSDMLDRAEDQDALFGALQHLRHSKHEVVLFHVMDQEKELNFEYHNRPYTFVDMETGEEIKLNPNQLQDKVKEIASARQKSLKLKCGMYRIDYVPADIRKGFNQVLMEYLIKRQKMI